MLGCQAKDNTNQGGTTITLTPASGVVQNDLVLVALNLTAVDTTARADWAASTAYTAGTIIMPTANNAGTYEFLLSGDCTSGSTEPNPWNQTLNGTQTDGTCTWINNGIQTDMNVVSVSSTGFNLINFATAGTAPTNVRQFYLWHIVTAGEAGTPTFTFTFSGNLRASGGALAYRQTCLNNASPCGNPIYDCNDATATATTTVSTGPLDNTGGCGNSGIPSQGEVVGAFGTNLSNTPLPSTGDPSPLNLRCTASVNGGLSMADYFNGGALIPNAGPFTATISSPGNTVGNVVSVIPKLGP